MTINLITTTQTLHHNQVEWNILSEIIAQFAYFECNKKALVSEIYLGRREELDFELKKIKNYQSDFNQDYRQIISQLFSKLPPDEALEKHVNYILKDGILNFSELNKLAHLLESVHFIKSDLPPFKISEFQEISGLDFIPAQRKFLREFRHLVDASGEVHFERHPELSDLNKRLKELEERIRKMITEWINSPDHSRLLQFNSYDVHYDRFVVPIRSDSYRSELGIIVSRSDSGQTLFVEPYEVREACNRRMELIAKIDEIINQLTIKFSRSLGEHSHLLQSSLRLLQRIDFYLAKIDFNEKYQLECPALREKPGFKFAQLFHPLIKKPVKNNVDCFQHHHGIVISGPNTGGKTVFLKSITLAYLLMYHGHFVPAQEAEMYPYEGLFYFGNDLQNLQSGLSSFSGEVKNYIELIENIDSSNLILIDEIFNSTSSDEASALSLSYFDELHRRAICHIVVSTHHQMFKTLIHQNRNYISCHVGFDTELMKPTYKIIWGTPGASMAIDIFKIISKDHDKVKDVPSNALNHLNTKNVSYETLLQKVSQKQIELDKLLHSTRQLEVDLKNQRGAMEGILNLKLNEELAKARSEIDIILNQARSLVEEARRNEIQKVKKIDEKSHRLKQEIDKIAGIAPEVKEEIARNHIELSKLKIGDVVFSHVLKKDFNVHSIDHRKNEVTISKGSIKLTVPSVTLGLSRKAPLSTTVKVSVEKSSETTVEFDVRGMRLSEFQSLIDKALGSLLSGDIPFLTIIHGHGDGILKNWLRDYLKRSKDFHATTPENGNDGETKITVK